ncbi:penicillin-binding protein 1A [Chitinivorax sp. PXF-14]|uniref:penicillin-binding protein 1A n=1 Tax=Chitinivorax sp. PXF-14 TaxID=3230488 RepID=UPI00346507C0
MSNRWIVYPLAALFGILLLAAGAVALLVILTYPRLPSLDTITDYKPKIPLRVYTSDGAQIGEFGEERRAFAKIEQVPQRMKQAILAAEDERFYEHGGVDFIAVTRAALSNLIPNHTRSGAGTITMQVARNFFLTREQTYSRKFNEALLAFKIEHNLSKDKILELYVNQIFLGQRAYGFAAAAQTYFGKNLDRLSTAEMAMLAGLPKAPSTFNPVANPKRAKQRQEYVLHRMLELNFINDEQYQQAVHEKLHVQRGTAIFSGNALYVAEMVRQLMFERYKEEAYTQGFKVYTTIGAAHQQAAYESVRRGLTEYDRRHGYRGPESFVELASDASDDAFEDELQKVTDADDLQPALVLAADSKQIKAYLKGGEIATVSGAGLKFAQRNLSDKVNPANRIRRGAIIRLQHDDKGQWNIVQLPQIETAFVAVDPNSGAVRALVGGFDFNRNNFNHVTQAWRQPGSSFKPFIYSSALEKGFTPQTIINDAPLVIDPATIGGQSWEPKNYDGTFSGPITMRNALTKSKNLVSIRILMSITPQYAQSYITKFGFDPKNHPPYLTMALGAGSVTPLQMAGAYSVFANGGYRVTPYFIDRIEDSRGNVLAKTQPEQAGSNAPQVIDPRNAFIMTSMMGDVVRRGTAAKAMTLGRKDLAGKTGTTNDQFDAWFAGYQRNLVAIVWMGYDQPKSLGSGETGGIAALPIWINYMGKALKGVPEYEPVVPEGVIARTFETENGGFSDYFYQEFTQTNPNLGLDSGTPSSQAQDEVKDMLF